VSQLTRWMDRTLYPRHGDNWDDTTFRHRIQHHLSPAARILDFGAGRGNVVQMRFKGEVAWVAGVDLDQAVLRNQNLDEARVIDPESGRIPFEDDTFDVVISDNVLEHVDDPVAVFGELNRVLKPGGVFLGKTPNRWHYMPLVAQCTPSWFHRLYNRWRGRMTFDTFPTRYRANSRGKVKRLCAETGFELLGVECVEGRPEYLRLWALTYLGGWAYERLVNASSWMSGLRSVMIIEARKIHPVQSPSVRSAMVDR
jgi:SAM-dependent methyltransferase